MGVLHSLSHMDSTFREWVSLARLTTVAGFLWRLLRGVRQVSDRLAPIEGHHGLMPPNASLPCPESVLLQWWAGTLDRKACVHQGLSGAAQR